MMKTRRKVKPGQPGTKGLMEQYGAKLVCVRYRYDEERRLRCKTVEIIVDESPWTPKPDMYSADETVAVHVGRVKLREIAVRCGVQLSDASWNSQKEVWEMRYEHVIKLGLKSKVVKRFISNARNK